MSQSYPQRGFVLAPDATEIVFVRHGASAHAVPGEPFPLTDGHGDPPLSEVGERQAVRVADRLAHEPVDAIFSSGLQRTDATAAPLVAATTSELSRVPELREVNLGEWEGGEFRIRMANHDPTALRAVAEERWDLIPGAEPMDALASRIRAGVERIVATTGPGRAVAFVHGGVIGELCRQATSSRPFAFVHSDNASLTRIVVLGDGRWLLRTFNDTAHLA